MVKRVINVDLARVYDLDHPRKVLVVLGWGDEIEVIEHDDRGVKVRVPASVQTENGSILGTAANGLIKLPKGKTLDDVTVVPDDNKVLKINFVDVQQGDGCVIESPGKQVVLVDGGDNQLFARYLAARFRSTSHDAPLEVAAVVVTHGDADHFAGLTNIHRSETNPTEAKRLFIHPKRIFHNGIFKRPSTDAAGKKRPDKELLNATVEVTREGDTETYLQPLIDAVTKVKAEDLNEPFRDWCGAIEAWRKRGQVIERRLAFGDHDAFDFLRDEDIDVQVLGPLTSEIGGRPALRFLGNPPKGPRIGNETVALDDDGFKGHSASHTINGHSLVLRISYGGFSFLLTGDLNDQAERYLVRAHNQGDLNLRSDLLKAPHHGSADYSPAFLQAVGATVSVISSGDESARKEYIHPRATLVGSLGRYSRAAEPIVLCTELVAFFQLVGWAVKDTDQSSDKQDDSEFTADANAHRFFAFKRTAYGLVKTACDGTRLLVTTNSGKNDLKEAYAYQLDEFGVPQAVPVRMI